MLYHVVHLVWSSFAPTHGKIEVNFGQKFNFFVWQQMSWARWLKNNFWFDLCCFHHQFIQWGHGPYCGLTIQAFWLALVEIRSFQTWAWPFSFRRERSSSKKIDFKIFDESGSRGPVWLNFRSKGLWQARQATGIIFLRRSYEKLSKFGIFQTVGHHQ